jgi:hypothetical protein
MKEREPKPEPTLIDILNDSLKRGTNDPDNFPTVEIIAERMGIERDTLHWWLENDREFKNGLTIINETHDKDPWKDTPDDEIKLDSATLSFGIAVVLEETKKRYTV